MSEERLAGRTAVVTGASRGIGLAIARTLGAAGARVVLLSRNAELLEQHVNEIAGAAIAIGCDLRDAAQVAAAVERLARELDGAPDILVLNAGIFTLGPVGELSPESFAATLQLSTVASYALLHALIPRMRERGSGDVITIGSIADRVAYPENAAYAAAKFAARGLHEVLRLELAGSGVRASLISPGPVNTALWDPIAPDDRAGFTPRARMLQPESVADAVVWVLTRPADVNVDELRLTRA